MNLRFVGKRTKLAEMTDIAKIKEHYDELGYAVVEGALRPVELEPLRSLLHKEVDDRARTFFSAGKLDELFESEPLQSRLLRLEERCPELRRGWRPNLHLSREIHALMTHHAVKEVITAVLGSEVFADGSPVLRVQNPSSTQATTAWHQDTSYTNDLLKKEGVAAENIEFVTCWVPLMDVDQRNGCMRVIPGSRNWGLVKSSRDEENHIRAQIDVEARGRPVSIPMKRGDLLVFHNLCLHCGHVNESGRLRWSVDFRYFPAPDSEGLDTEQKRILDTMSHNSEKNGRPSFRAVSGSGRQTSYEEWVDEARSLEISSF